MPRRRAVLPLVLSAAACAVAIPIAAIAAPAGDDLPDLRADPPANPYLQEYGDGRLLLRFDGFVTNVGTGPLDVSGNPNGAMWQRVNDGGSLVNDHQVPVQYETADGHNHFHLMRIMRYSLWNASRTAEVAPGQKVGFCLYDYAQATDFTGTRDPQVYALDRPGDDFCRRNKPGATSLTMGVSSGWRDDYGAYLALQWVDVSSTTPGRYHLAADADPNGIIRESNESNARAFAPSMVTVPGYVAKPIGPVDASGDAPTQIALASDRYATSGDLGTPGPVSYRVVQQPARGSVSVSGATATYTPGSGAPGTDTFTYAAADAQSPYPRTATPATVTLRVGDAQAVGVSISGAPASLTAGTSAQLSATVVNAGPGVTWSADAGTVSPQGLYVAPATPPPGGVATVRATSVDAPGASAQVQIAITPPPPRTPAPGGVGSGPVIAATPAGLPRTVTSAVARGALGAPTLTRNRRVIVVRTLARAAGRLTVSAVRGRKGVATCRVKARAGRRATCLVRLPKRLAAKPVRIVVALESADGTRASRRAMSTPRRG